MTPTYKHWYREAEKWVGLSAVTVMIVSGRYDEKLGAEISVAVKLNKPVYLLLKEGERPPLALEAADVIRGIESYRDIENFGRAAQRLVDRMASDGVLEKNI